MTTIIGSELVIAVNNDLGNLQCALELYMEKFNGGDGKGRKIEVDYKPVMKQVQNLEDIVTPNGDVTLSKQKLADLKVQDALAVLSLILDHLIIVGHGVRSACEAVLLEQNVGISLRSSCKF